MTVKEDEIKKSYEELKFSEDLPERYLQAADLQEGDKRRKKIHLAPMLIGILMVGTTIYGAERFDWFNWYFKENYPLIQESADRNRYSTQNEHLKMSVENTVFTKEYGMVFLHIQALDEEGKAFMEQNQESLQIELAAENDAQADTGGLGSRTRLCQEISDEENWYYLLQTINHKTSDSPDYETARVTFRSTDSMGEGELSDVPQAMELTFPVTQTIGTSYVFKQCEGFLEVSVSPLTVTLVWETEKSQFMQYVQTVEIGMKDGERITYENQPETQLSPEWDAYLYSSDEAGKNILTLISKEILDVENIADVRVNGTACK